MNCPRCNAPIITGHQRMHDAADHIAHDAEHRRNLDAVKNAMQAFERDMPYDDAGYDREIAAIIAGLLRIQAERAEGQHA